MITRLQKLTSWLTLDMIIFVIANIFLLSKIPARNNFWQDLNFLRLAVLGLAAYRAANIISNEPVTHPLRAPFVTEKEEAGKIVETPKKSGFRGAVGLLIYCPSCTGVWLAAALVYSYVFWPNQTFIIALVLALSGVERIVSRILERLRKS